MNVNEGSEKAGLKLNIQKTKVIWSHHFMGKKWKVTDFISLGFKITMDSGNSHELKRCLLLERRAMTNLDSILKSRDITFLTKFCIVKAIIFPVVMCRCESWIIKKIEC